MEPRVELSEPATERSSVGFRCTAQRMSWIRCPCFRKRKLKLP